MEKEPPKIRKIFAKALEQPTTQGREDYLDLACKGDADLRSRLEMLLQAHEEAGDFLESPVLGTCMEQENLALTEGPGTVIGNYKLLERIGEGGMAVVYMAEQERPIHRKVALKIIKLGMDTRSMIARFEAERQALAIMDHPHIAKVYDAGATDAGRPYFVMELVRGESITDFCDREKLPTAARLGLFLQVCDAVQHAHQRGIIHRDLKPSNIMVTMRDDSAVPKVIDFGISKATKGRLTEKTVFTRYAQIIGTPAYMSPEQAQMSELDIDTRSDIYSLGVLLYELLTGTAPFSEEQLRRAGYLEMQRIIREVEPVKPSTKLSAMGGTLTDIAKQRCSTPEMLRKTIRGDLDWIVMKSLEKNRTRRYETANAFKRDLQRYQQHRPVDARKPNAIYWLQKYLYRHRIQAVLALAVALMMGAAIAFLSTWHQRQLQYAERESREHRDILSDVREAYAGGDVSLAIKHIQLILSSPHIGPEAQLFYASCLVDGQYYSEAVDQLRNLLDAKPEIAGAAHALWARIIGEKETTNAERLQEIDAHQRKAKALLPETAEAYFLRAMMAFAIKEKLGLLDRALDLDRGHYEACRLRAYIDYASNRFERVKDDALVMTAKQPGNPLGYSLRGMAQQGLGEHDGAIAQFEHALRVMPPEDPGQAQLHARICEVYLCRGDYDRALAQATAALKRFPNDGKFHFHIFCALTARGDYEEAIRLFKQMAGPKSAYRDHFRYWSQEYVFDTLDAGRAWHAPDSKPSGAAFLAMLEAEENYIHRSAKARRVINDGFTARWSPDGTKLAYGLGMLDCSGLAVYDPATQKTELLMVPGKDPAWSPDGRYLAFVREARNLRLAELAVPEQRNRRRVAAEVWIMKADGTEPQRLAQGFWPSWNQDSKTVYFVQAGMLYSIGIEDREASPKPILACTGRLPSISPDSRYVAYVEGESLKITELASQSLYAQCNIPPMMWGGHWSPDSRQFSLGAFLFGEIRTGLWIYDLDTREVNKVLNGQVNSACWSMDGSKLTFSVGPPFFEVWLTDIDPRISTTQALGPGRSYEEHFHDMADFYTRRIQADSDDIENVLHRAECYHYLHDQAGFRQDMQQYFTTLYPSAQTNLHDPWYHDFLWGLWQSTPVNLGPTVNSPAMDQAPSISTDGLTLYLTSTRADGFGGTDIWMTTRESEHAPWRMPENLGSAINSQANDWASCLSADGLSLYFASNRPQGFGGDDIYVSIRPTPGDPWGVPVNLGAKVNSPKDDSYPSISTDGLSLFLGSFRPGGCGPGDLWMTKRATIDEAWGSLANLGPLVNTQGIESAPDISSDGLMLFFSSSRSEGAGAHDIWVTRRVTKDAAWGAPMNLGPTINKQNSDYRANLSANGSALYFTSHRPGCGSGDLWQVSVLPLLSDAWEAGKEN